MLRSLNELYNYVLAAEDGDIGRCKDFLFDDEFWTVRYMVADTHKWFAGKKVLISPVSLGTPDWVSGKFPVLLTKERIKNAPDLDEDAPVSRQYEILWHKYHGWPVYWEGPGPWGYMGYPYVMPQVQLEAAVQKEMEDPELKDQHLRSAKEVEHYHIQALDEEVGHVEDYILDDEAWIIRYVVVDTRNFLPGQKVLVSPSWIRKINWELREVDVDITAEKIKNSPEYDPRLPVNREYEQRLFDFYGRPVYWE